MRVSLAVAVLVLLAGSTDAASGAKKKPNILFIYADDQSHRTVSCYPEAYDWVRTPNIDQLAKSGIRFSHAYIGTWCMPSRGTLLTGKHPYGLQSMKMAGEYPGSSYDPQQCPFWPAFFRMHGYFTAQIGKWHTGVDTGFGRDWDYQVVWNRPRFPDNAGNYYYDQLIEKNGGKAELVKGYSTDNYTKWAVDFIKGKTREPNKPWYLWLCYGAIHGPFTPAKRHLDDFPNPTVPTPVDIYPPRPGKPAYMQKVENWVKGKDGQPIMKGGKFESTSLEASKGIHGNTLAAWVRQYHQCILAVDEGVGQLIAALKESGQADNTLIIYTADQGFAFGQHGFRHKLAPYDANLRTPFIVSMPGTLPEGAVCETPIGGADLVPTFFRFAGLKMPWEMHGHDLTPLLHNPKADWPHPVLITLTGRSYGSDTDIIPTDPKLRDLSGIPWWVFLVKGRYKYIRTLVAGEVEELYDLQEDSGELKNLALQAEHRARLAEYRAALIAELRRTRAGMVNNLPRMKTED